MVIFAHTEKQLTLHTVTDYTIFTEGALTEGALLLPAAGAR